MPNSTSRVVKQQKPREWDFPKPQLKAEYCHFYPFVLTASNMTIGHVINGYLASGSAAVALKVSVLQCVLIWTSSSNPSENNNLALILK